MPAYDYKCKTCDEVFEIKRSPTDDAPVTCPSCKGETRRVFTPVGVVFKGSGFHNTDYKNKPDGGGELAVKPKELAQSSTADTAPASEASCGASKSDGGACATCPAASE
jgi:putative FmdB family regulatory protein